MKSFIRSIAIVAGSLIFVPSYASEFANLPESKRAVKAVQELGHPKDIAQCTVSLIGHASKCEGMILDNSNSALAMVMAIGSCKTIQRDNPREFRVIVSAFRNATTIPCT